MCFDEYIENVKKEAVQTSYEKAGQQVCPGESVTKETVMRQVREKDIPAKSEESSIEKKKAKYLYIEADEDHIALQFNEKKEI